MLAYIQGIGTTKNVDIIDDDDLFRSVKGWVAGAPRYFVRRRQSKQFDSLNIHRFVSPTDAGRFLTSVDPYGNEIVNTVYQTCCDNNHISPLDSNGRRDYIQSQLFLGHLVVEDLSLAELPKQALERLPPAIPTLIKQAVEQIQPQEEIEKNWVDLQYFYTDGSGVSDASYEVYNAGNALLASGKLNAQGFAHVDLPLGEQALHVLYHSDPKNVALLKSSVPSLIKEDANWLDRMQDSISSGLGWSWELLQGDFNENPTVGQIITNAIITAIPVVDQVADVRDICACIKFLAWDKRYEDKAVWITVVFTVIGLVPTVGSLLKGVFKLIYKGAKLDELLEVFNFFKKGNGVAWLKELHGGKLKQHMQEAASIAHQIFDACTSKLIEVQAFLPRYLTDAHNNIVELLVNLEKTKAMINGKFAEIGDELVAKLGKILGESKPPKPASAKDKLSVQQSQTPPPKDNDYILLTSSNVTVLEPGKKGGWNKALNGKLKPNHKYQVGDYLYETDDLSRVHKVSGELKLGVRDRNTYQQTKSAKVDGIKDGLTEDDGGHLIASIFDGAGEQINYAPMNANLNRGAWKAMENKWARALNGDPPKTVKVDIQPIYPQSSTRPSKFIVEYEVDGEPFTEIFRNKSGGK